MTTNAATEQPKRWTRRSAIPPDSDLAALVRSERERVRDDPSYTPVERLRLAAAFSLLGSTRPTAITKGLETYERVEAAHHGSLQLAVTAESEALAVAERRLAELRSGQ